MRSSSFHARYLVRHLACGAACRRRRHLRRDTRPSAIQVHRVVLLDSRADGVRKADIGQSQEPRTAAIAMARVRLGGCVAALDKLGSSRATSLTFGHEANMTADSERGFIETPSVPRGCDRPQSASPAAPCGQQPGACSRRSAVPSASWELAWEGRTGVGDRANDDVSFG
jgi:hypothetical protein